ncbi:MAG: IS4 family transposase [Planctomycetota bacterium]
MSLYRGDRSLPQRFRLVVSSFLQKDALPFADILSETQIQEAFEEEGVSFANEEDTIYTPAITLWAFLSQVLFKGEQRSCLAAVARVIVLLVTLGREACATNSGAYCRARARLPEQVIQRLTLEVAGGCERQLPRRWLWHGRHVKLVDGTTVSMPDTDANQAEYPQHPEQKEGLGFPMARMVVLLSLASAMISGMAIGPYSGKETGEMALLRELVDQLNPGDIVLGDRYYCSYFMIALLLELRVDFVVRLHQSRTADFHRGERLGRCDHVVTWTRPQRPPWMDQETYQRMPESITVRELKVEVNQPGFRTDAFVVVTTLTDAKEYSKDDIAELYRKRWLVELDIRAIKITLDMDILRCKSPEMVRKEIWTCLLAYNLIRKTMLQAAKGAGLSPRQLSFTLAMQTVAASWMVLITEDENLIDAQLASLTGQLVGNRPDRIEPRAVKRRPKPCKYLTKPRDEARAELLAGVAE